MRDLVPLLRKVFVNQFYRDNAAFFLLVITLCFGFLSGREHRALAEGFLASGFTLMIPIAIWLYYLAKLVRYNFQSAGKPENAAIKNLQLLSFRQRLAPLSVVTALQFLPAIAYGAFLVAVATRLNLWIRVVEIIFILVAFVAVGAVTLDRFVTSLRSERRIYIIERFFNFRFTRPFPLLCLEVLARKEPVLLITTKIFSCTLIVAIATLYQHDTYDWRLFALGVAVAFSGNQVVVNAYHKMINHDLLWVRNLPLPLWKRLSYSLTILFTVSIPEFVTISRNFPDYLDLDDLAGLIFFGTSVQLLFYAVLYNAFAGAKANTYFYAAMIAWLFAILFSVPLYALTGANLALALLFYRFGFYRFEYHGPLKDH
jgi:hypothetical protein